MAKFVSLDRLSKFLEQVKTLIPTVNNPTITIKQAGSNKGSFTLNQSGATTIELTDNNTTYSAATTSKAGLMSAADKTKLGVTNIAYATCATAAATAAKVATITGNDNWALAVGSIVCVRYDSTNTASSCTLNVNGTGEKQLWYGSSVYTGNSNIVCGYADRYNYYMYDGTYWVYMGRCADSNTTYSKGTTSALGLTKLYTTTGTATDGTLTQAAITDLIGDVETLLAAI